MSKKNQKMIQRWVQTMQLLYLINKIKLAKIIQIIEPEIIIKS